MFSAVLRIIMLKQLATAGLYRLKYMWAISTLILCQDTFYILYVNFTVLMNVCPFVPAVLEMHIENTLFTFGCSEVSLAKS